MTKLGGAAKPERINVSIYPPKIAVNIKEAREKISEFRRMNKIKPAAICRIKSEFRKNL